LEIKRERRVIKCYYEYCVYQKDNACILDDVEINSIGMCEHAEVVSLGEDFLAAAKQRRLDEIAQRWSHENEK
jgi:hypothetical protein